MCDVYRTVRYMDGGALTVRGRIMPLRNINPFRFITSFKNTMLASYIKVSVKRWGERWRMCILAGSHAPDMVENHYNQFQCYRTRRITSPLQ